MSPAGLGSATYGRTVTEVDVDGTMLDVEAPFCYLCDMPGPGGGCDRAQVARWCMALEKFRELLPVLTTRYYPLT